MEKSKFAQAVKLALEDKGKKKFKQSVELIMNFRGINFSKPENRLNIDVVLPKGKGKHQKVVVFAETTVALEAKNAGAEEVIDGPGIPKLVADHSRLKNLVKESEFLAQPSLMVLVGKNMGQALGAKGKLPKPIVGISTSEAIKQARSRVKISSKGKYLPVAQCLVGSEDMSPEDILENIDSVYERVKAKVSEPSIKSVYVKLSMGKAVKVA
ncbi:MAG TPA: hypothetical protein PLO51_02375 [Candidatus Micrarchaeota archaeon]|nr:hypothetical protein [Candidatus Micrarchaeota archaeon]